MNVTRAGQLFENLRNEGLATFARRRFAAKVGDPFRFKVLYPLGMARHRRKERRHSAAWQRPAAGTKTGRVYLVSCIDTEGPSTWDVNTDWSLVAREVERVHAPAFRSELADSDARPLAVSWFVMDWAGAERTRRGRDVGFHRVLDRYLEWVAQARAAGYRDEIYWHYHHIDRDNYESSNRNWAVNPAYEEILSRWILECGVWPVVYRAGNTWEDNASSRWLERWFPFDLSNRAPHWGRNFDWSGAPITWTLYHPADEHFQREGRQRRLLGRSMSLEDGWFSPEDVEPAFQRAAQGEDSYVSFYTHDYKAMAAFLRSGVEVVKGVAAKYPHVTWHHANALDLFRSLAAGEPREPLVLDAAVDGQDVVIRANHEIFGEQPWLAAKFGATCARLETVRDADGWRCTLPSTPDAIAAAASDAWGNSAVVQLERFAVNDRTPEQRVEVRT